MADNVAITAGSGTSIATDDVGGAHYQKMKLYDATADSSTPVAADSTYGLAVEAKRVTKVGTVVDANNSTTAALNEAQVFTGTAIDCLGYEAITVFGKSDKFHGVDFQFSIDGTNWDWTEFAGDFDSTLTLFSHTPVKARYFRVVVTQNDTGNDTYLRFQTLLHTHPPGIEVQGPDSSQSGNETLQRPVAVRPASNFENQVTGLYSHDGIIFTDKPVVVGGYAKATAPADVSADGDVTNQWFLRNGAAVTNLAAGGTLITGDGTNGLDTDITRIAAGDNNIGNVDIVTMPNVTLAAGTNTNEVVGDVAHNVADAGNPVKIGAYASAAAPSDVGADGRVTNVWALRNGSQVVNVAAGGTLITGDGSNGLDVDVTRLPALVAGTANIGDVDVLTVPSDPFGANADAASVSGSISAKLRQIATNGIKTTDGSLTAGLVDETGSSAVDSQAVGGGTPHDSVNSGNPLYLGAEAIAHGTNPTAVAAADRTKLYANRAGIPFVIGGHPNVVTLKHTTITTAVTDAAIVTISTGLKIVVTRISVTLDNASTVFPTLLIGFGTANTPTTTGVLIAHGGVPAGGGITVGDGSGILGVGADNEDLRVTTTGNATGNGLQIVVTYYTIES